MEKIEKQIKAIKVIVALLCFIIALFAVCITVLFQKFASSMLIEEQTIPENIIETKTEKKEIVFSDTIEYVDLMMLLENDFEKAKKYYAGTEITILNFVKDTSCINQTVPGKTLVVRYLIGFVPDFTGSIDHYPTDMFLKLNVKIDDVTEEKGYIMDLVKVDVMGDFEQNNIESIVSALADSPAKAALQYVGKNIEVTGVLEKKENYLYITSFNNKENNKIIAWIPHDELRTMISDYKLETGDTVTIKGYASKVDDSQRKNEIAFLAVNLVSIKKSK